MAYTFDDDDPFSAMYVPPASAPTPTLPSVSDGSPLWDDPQRPGFDPGISAEQTPAGYADLPPVAPDKMPGGDASGLPAVNDATEFRNAGLRALAAQQKARGLQPGEVPAEEIAALRAKGGMALAQEVYDREGRRMRVTSPNKAYPSTTKHVGAMLGSGEVSQAVGPDGQPMFRTEIVDEPIIGADGQPMLDPLNPSGPPLMRQVEKQVPVLQQDTGLLGGEREAALRVQEAELDREMMNTSLLQQQEMEQRKIHNAMLTSQMAQRRRAEAVRKNVDDSYKAVEKATAEFNKAGDVDPDRGWGEKGVGSKIAAIIASGLLGFAGMDPFAHINAVINNSIDAQKANIAKRQAAVGEARGQQAAAVSAYDQIRAQIGDEAQADAAYYVSALEGIKAQALAKLSQAGVKVMTAQQAAFMNGIDQQLSERRRQHELVAATTPESFTRYVDPRTPGQRAMDKELFKSGLRTQEKGGDQAVDIIAKRQEQGRDTQGKIDIADQTASKPNPENRRMIAKETAVANRVRALAADLLADIKANNGDVPGVGSVHIPGVGAPTHQLTREARDFRRRLDLLNQYDITDLTGAVASPEQMDVIQRFTSGDESSIASGLTEIVNSMDAYVNTIEGADPEAAAAIREHTGKGLGGWRGGRTDAGPSRYMGSKSVEEDR